MKRRGFFGFCMVMMSITAFAQNTEFEVDRFSFFMTPKPLKNGSIIDVGFGYRYGEDLAWEFMLRRFTETRNEEFPSAEDSLVIAEETKYELFLTPVEYFFIRNESVKLKGGLGVYYGYNNQTEKGFFNMPILTNPVNSIYGDSTTNVLGPLVKFGLSYRSDWFGVTGNIDVVPAFYLNANQSMAIVPLMNPGTIKIKQDTFGSPYIFADINLILFKYFSVSLLYDFAFFKSGYINFDYEDSAFIWTNIEMEIMYQSIKTEVSLLLPVYGSLSVQIGFGYTFDMTTIDSSSPVKSNKQYLLLSTKITN